MESGLFGLLPFHVPPKKRPILLKALILSLIYIVAFVSRLFSIIRYESVIHEFDPYFNFRTTKYLIQEGFYSFHNWFDTESWYPLGRIIGGTIYPGLMVTAAYVYWALHALHFTVDIRNVCVLLAPWMASNTTLITYYLGKEIRDEATGIVAAALIAIVPGYISRSVAGSYDNEAVAIFALLWVFSMFVKAVKTGSLFYACMSCLAYFYMVSAWGGYIFIINLLPLYVFTMLVTGRYSHRLYVAYTTFYTLGTLLSMQITFVGFQPVYSGEHVAAFLMFGLLQVYSFVLFLQSHLEPPSFRKLIVSVILLGGAVVIVAGSALSAAGYIAPWTGRFYTLLDPTYAKEHIPIISSVSEHQPTTWGSFFFDLHFLTILFPAGMYFLFQKLTDANIFIILYGMTSVYFAGVMVRLMLVVAPVACVMGGVAVSTTLKSYMRHIKTPTQKKKAGAPDVPREVAIVVVLGILFMLVMYVFHCTWVTSEAYSSPSIVLSAKQGDGSRAIFDDFREAYYWIRHNTPEDAKIMSWWDYGYQITAMANRTILVDNNTWNNTHIATVGRAFSSDENTAFEIMKHLDVSYVLVWFGGLTGYASDDINKFLWMVRIAGGVFPEIREPDYFTPNGEFRVDAGGSKVLLNSLMYKTSYYRFGEIMTDYGQPTGFDRVRNVEIGNKNFVLEHLEEAYTTEHWLCRIYRVKTDKNRGN